MAEAISGPRTELNRWAPRIESIQIPKDKIGEVIGPKGKVVRELEEQTGATIEIEEEAGYGIVRVASADGDALAAAKERIMQIVFPPEPELGKEYEGEVVNITKFGAFVNILPGRDGLLHISKLDTKKRVERVEDYLSLGDKIQVVLTEIDRNGKLSLSMAGAEAPAPAAAQTPSVPREDGPRRRPNGDRDRDRDRDSNRDRAPAPEAQPEPSGDRRRASVSFEDTFEEMRKP
jgi:polyribonucleotide nucleotidyltransferase